MFENVRVKGSESQWVRQALLDRERMVLERHVKPMPPSEHVSCMAIPSLSVWSALQTSASFTRLLHATVSLPQSAGQRLLLHDLMRYRPSNDFVTLTLGDWSSRSIAGCALIRETDFKSPARRSETAIW